MDVERTIEGMSRDTREYLKDLVSVYKRTRQESLAAEILEILNNHGARTSIAEVRQFFL